MAATYEVRFQTVAPEKRDAYVKMYQQAIQEIKQAGCTGIMSRQRSRIVSAVPNVPMVPAVPIVSELAARNV